MGKEKNSTPAPLPGSVRARLRPYRSFLLFQAGILLLAAVLFVYLYLLRVWELPFSCHIHDRLHIYCPGCGCTRALEELLRLRPIASFLSNPMVLLGGLCAIYYEISLFRAARHRTRASALPAILYVAAILVFFVIRNILLIAFRVDYLNDLVLFWS